MRQPLYADARVERVPLDQVMEDPDQPRQAWDPTEFALLKASLARHGQLDPVRAVPDGDRLRLLEGHRRRRALLELGADHIDVIRLRPELSARDRLVYALVANCRREGLHYLDKAQSFAQLLERHGWTQGELAAEVGEDPPTVSKLLCIGQLDAAVKRRLRERNIGFVQAYGLARLGDTAAQLARLEPQGDGAARPGPAAKRIVCPLGSGITVSLAGAGLDWEGFLYSLEFVLREARKHKAKGIELATVGRLFQDLAKPKGGQA